MHHIRNTLPEIKAKITAALSKYQVELAQLGDPLVDTANQGVTYKTIFSCVFSKILNLLYCN